MINEGTEEILFELSEIKKMLQQGTYIQNSPRHFKGSHAKTKSVIKRFRYKRARGNIGCLWWLVDLSPCIDQLNVDLKGLLQYSKTCFIKTIEKMRLTIRMLQPTISRIEWLHYHSHTGYFVRVRYQMVQSQSLYYVYFY